MESNRYSAADKQALKDKLAAIVLLETSKPYKEMNGNLVTECVDFLMELEEKARLTNAEIKKRVNKIPFEGSVTAIGSQAKKKTKTKRIVVIAAVLTILLAIFSFFAVSFTRSEDGLIDRLAQYIVGDMKPGEHIKINNIELIKHNETKTFSSVQELVRSEKISVLFPTWLPEGNRITTCRHYSDDIYGTNYILVSEDPECTVAVYIENLISKEIKETNLSKKINEHTVYIIECDGFVQGDFEHNGNHYSVSAHTEDEVLKIIKNLKEIK